MRSISIVAGLLFVFSSLLAKPAYQEIAPGKYLLPGQIVVKLKPDVPNSSSSQAASRVFQKCQAQKVEKLFNHAKHSSRINVIDLSRIYQVDIPENVSVLQLCQELENDPAVEYAEPVILTRPHLVPNDSLYNLQSHLPQIQAEAAWDVAQGSPEVIIGIVDTGVDWDHPDLAGSVWRNEDEELDGTDTDGNGYIDDIRGWDWVSDITDVAPGEDGDVPDNNPMDFNGHGTHCSGLAAAITNNRTGVAGIGGGCKVMPLRIGWQNAAGDGLGNSTWMARAFVYAADNGAHVVNLSYGNSGKAIQDAALYAWQLGVVVVTSAGNDETDVSSDALDIFPFIVKVAAVDPYDRKAWYSNFGDWVTLSAPGGDHSPGLLSTYPDDDYQYASGTSMSSPVVCGLVGLVKSHFTEMTPAELVFQITGTTDAIDALNPNYPGLLGTGRINAYRALTETVVPDPDIKLKSFSFNDDRTGNQNGIIDIGETVEVVIELENLWGPAHNITAVFETDDPCISIENAVANLGTVHGIDDYAASQSTTNADEPFVISVDSLSLPHPIAAKLVLTGDHGFRQEFSMVLPIRPSILFVDDDSEEADPAPQDISDSYYAALSAANISVFHYNRNAEGAITQLDQYPTIIWGCEASSPGMIYVDYYFLEKYLDQGGNLFLAGQNLGWDFNDPASPVTNDGSKAFYTNYLHANYVTNASKHHTLASLPGDPIGGGLQISVNEPGRPAADQTPCEITPANGGVSIFDYPNGNSGAVRFAGDYRMVYFAFGGLEAITEADKRDEILRRTLDWLNGLQVDHRPLGDTENTTIDYPVNVSVKSTKAISRVELFWNPAGTLPFTQSLPMTALNDSTYQAFIPAQDSGTVVYTVYVENEVGYYSYKIHEFKIGSDAQAPVIAFDMPLMNTLDKFGPYHLNLTITDNQAVDTSKVWLFHAKKGTAFDSTKIQWINGNKFLGKFSANATYGDTIVYWVKARDISANQNMALSSQYEFGLGMDAFEDPTLAGWKVISGDWGLDSTQVAAGNFALTESPWRNLGPNELHILQLKSPLDLTTSASAMLLFQTQYNLQRNLAIGYVEVSADSGKTWEELYRVTGLRRTWGEVELSLQAYTGKQILLRLRVESKAGVGANFDGWYVDEMVLRADLPLAVSNDAGMTVPEQFILHQNYPNPFNPATHIRYGLPRAGRVTLVVFDLLGREVKTLLDQKQSAGFHQVVWDGTNHQGQLLSSGVYFYRITAGDFVQTRKMVWIK